MNQVPLVFVHGLKGSMLVDSANCIQYLTASQLFFRSGNLSLPIKWEKYTDYLQRHEDEEKAKPPETHNDDTREPSYFKYRHLSPPEYIQEFDGMRATQPLDAVTLIPYVITKAIYAPFTQWARKTRKHFFPFAYDWRRDPTESAERLLQFLEKIQREYGKPQIVAHSMGGLITFAGMLSLGPEKASNLIHSVVFCGVPFGSGVGVMSTTHDGDTYLRNDVLTGPLAFATFPSGFIFYPVDDDEAQRHGGQIRDAAGQRIAMNWFDAKEWERLKIGPFSYPAAQFDVTDAFRQHFQRTLDAARRFALLNRGHLRGDQKQPPQKQHDDLTIQSPPLQEEIKQSAKEQENPHWPACAVFMSDCHPTKNVFAPHNDPRKRGWAITMVDAEPGDGSVRRSASVPVFEFPHRFYLARPGKNSSHVDLCSKVDELSPILDELLKS